MSEVASLSTIQTDPIIKLLNEELTFDQKEIFIESFALYLKYDEETDFVVELDNKLCARLGYNRKDNAKKVLLKHFTAEEDYKISLRNLAERSGSISKGGENQEKIMLNVRTLKEFSMVANTPEAKIFKKYYLSMERILHKHSKRQLEQQDQEKRELTNQVQQLQIKSKESQEEKERLAAELENLKKTKKYDEIEKTGCNYTLKTDSLDFYRNGMSKNKDCKNRVSSHQTSNEQEIEVLHEFKTSCPKLLESCIHYALEVYRSNSGREFFKCKLDHIVNIVDIIGHVLDTCRSSYENITRVELIEKVLEKLHTEIHVPEVQTEEYRAGSTEVEQWVNENIIYEVGSYLLQSALNNKYFTNPRTSTKEKGRFKVNVEHVLEKYKVDHPSFQNLSKLDRFTGTNKQDRGWRDIKLI